MKIRSIPCKDGKTRLALCEKFGRIITFNPHVITHLLVFHDLTPLVSDDINIPTDIDVPPVFHRKEK